MRRLSSSLALMAASSLSVAAQEPTILLDEDAELTAIEIAATDPAPGLCLPIADAMQAAASASPDVAVAQAQIAGAKADLQLARSLSRPQVSSFARTQAGDGGLTGNAIDNQVGLRASQRLWDFGDARFAREAANSRVGSAEQTQLSVEAYASRRFALSYIPALQPFEPHCVTRQRDASFLPPFLAL